MRYRVDFYDIIDGWIGGVLADPHEFDELADAKALRDKLNDELSADNKKAGEHYGVIDLSRYSEVDCPMEKEGWLPGSIKMPYDHSRGAVQIIGLAKNIPTFDMTVNLFEAGILMGLIEQGGDRIKGPLSAIWKQLVVQKKQLEASEGITKRIRPDGMMEITDPQGRRIVRLAQSWEIGDN